LHRSKIDAPTTAIGQKRTFRSVRSMSAIPFFVPGVDETYRVNGRARICHDAEFKRRFAVNGKEPATVMIVTVEETFQHCAKALVEAR